MNAVKRRPYLGQEIVHFLPEAFGATDAGFESSGPLHRPSVQFGSSFIRKQDLQSGLEVIDTNHILKGEQRITTQGIKGGLQVLVQVLLL
jgi:hypothetical protein